MFIICLLYVYYMFIISYFPFGDQAFTHSLDTRSGNCWHSWNSRGSSSQSTCAHVSWPNMECYAQPFPNAQLEPPLVQVHRFHVLNPHWSIFSFVLFFTLLHAVLLVSLYLPDPSAWRSTWYVRPRTPCSTPGTPIPRWAWVHSNWKIAASFCSCKTFCHSKIPVDNHRQIANPEFANTIDIASSFYQTFFVEVLRVCNLESKPCDAEHVKFGTLHVRSLVGVRFPDLEKCLQRSYDSGLMILFYSFGLGFVPMEWLTETNKVNWSENSEILIFALFALNFQLQQNWAMAFPSQNVPGADGYKFPAPDLADWPETPETREILQRIKTIQRLLRFALVDFQYFWVVYSVYSGIDVYCHLWRPNRPHSFLPISGAWGRLESALDKGLPINGEIQLQDQELTLI